MNDLGTALRGLAGGVEAPNAADPVDLWARGRTRVVRRRLRAVAGVVAVIAIGYLGTVRPMPTAAMQAGDLHTPAIPENIWSPNRFLTGVAHEGPPGRLALIATKSINDGSGAWFGISASTGEYSFLDLPDRAPNTTMRLSPDGRRIAYWTTGPTPKTDFPTVATRRSPDPGGSVPDHPVTGLAVYDTADGSVTRDHVSTDYGIRPESDGSEMAWLNDDTLVFQYGVVTGVSSVHDAARQVWHPGESDPAVLSSSGFDGWRYFPSRPGPDSLRGARGSTKYAVVGADAKATGRVVRLPANNFDMVTQWGSRVVATGYLGNGGSATQVFLGAVTPDGSEVKFKLLGGNGIANPDFLGWRSPTSILVSATPGELVDGQIEPKSRDVDQVSQTSLPRLYSIDLTSDAVRSLGFVHGDLDDSMTQVASELVGQPMVHGLRPPSVFAALYRPIGIPVLVVVALGAVWLWRRRKPWRVKPWRHYLTTEWQRSDRV